ncbi:MAG: cadherin domain-containing protein [Pirellulaceae bacterium]|nr:cadherin domain-containing protein [Pirellulaceae bacterium]
MAERLERRDLLATLGDLVWQDRDGDGLQHASEGGVLGAVVELLDAGGNSLGTRITGPSGQYAFTGLSGGDYRLEVRLPVGYAVTLADAGGSDALDSDFDPQTGRSELFSLGADDDLTRDAGLAGAAPDFGFALRAGNTGVDWGQALALDAAGNVYVTGSFSGVVDFDHGPGTWNLTSASGEDIFLAKYTSTGALVWARALSGGGPNDEGLGIAVTADGQAVATGRFSGTVDFDPSAAGQAELTAAGDDDVFVVKLDADGRFQWARQFGAAGTQSGQAVALDATGGVVVTGQFTGLVDFDPGLGELPLDGGLIGNAFVLKLNQAGDLAWARATTGGESNAVGLAVGVGGDGQVIVAGQYSGSVHIGGTLLAPRGGTDLFVARWDSEGTPVWARGFGGTSADTLGGLVADAGGNVILAGGFAGTVDFDPGSGVHQLTAVAGGDAFLSKLDAGGNFTWARTYGGAGQEQATGVALDANGNIYASGLFQGSVDFDPGLGLDVLASAGGSDIFVAKLDPLGNHVKALSVGGEGEEHVASLAVDGLGRVFVTGHFQTAPNAPADFDPGPGLFGLESAGDDDLFVARLSLEDNGNSAPVLEPIGIIILIDEDEPTTIALDDWVNNGPGTTTIVDVDAGDPLGGIAVVMTVGRGIFWYSLDGTNWIDVGDVSHAQALLLPADVALRYEPDTENGETAELTYRAWDGTVGGVGQYVSASPAGGDGAFSLQTETITFDVADANDAPVLTPANSLVTTDEDTVLEFAVSELSSGAVAGTGITDVDQGDPVGGVALTSLQGFGLLSYSLDGTTFVPAPQLSEFMALLLPPSARVRYRPQGDHGELALLTYRAWDQSDGQPGGFGSVALTGPRSAFSAQSDTLRIQVTDVNDAPLLLPAGPTASTTEDNPLIMSLGSRINAGPNSTSIVDLDPGDPVGGVAVIGVSGNGHWQYSLDFATFHSIAPVSDSSALLLPAGAILRYSPDTANGETASLSFRAWDQSQGDPEARADASANGGTTPFSGQQDTLWVNVSGFNDPPTGILLDDSSIAENLAGGVVGNLTVIDPDHGETFQFQVSDPRFEVLAGQLKLVNGLALDHEQDPEVMLSVTVTDSGSEQFTQAFTIAVLDVNEPPTALGLSNPRVAENAAGAVVGQLSVDDPDDGDSHEYQVSDQRFEVVNGQLKLKAGTSLDHEAEDSIDLEITVVDSGGLQFAEQFVVAVDDRNEPPASISLSDNQVTENVAGAVIGTLSVTDPDEGDQHTFRLSDDRFEVTGGQLKLKPQQSLDFEAEPQVLLQVTAIDSGTPGLELTVPLTIQVGNVNEPATAVELTPAEVPENLPGAVIGLLKVIDPESGDKHQLELSDDRFELVENQLRLKSGQSLDHESESTVELEIKVTGDGQPVEQVRLSVTVTVLDVNEAPQLAAPLANRHGMSNHPLEFALAGNSFTDVDEDDQLVLSATLQDGSPLPGWLVFDVSSGTFSGTPSIYDPGQYPVLVTATDQGNLTADGLFMIDIQPSPAPWQNPFNWMDVNADGLISPVDILIIINYINTHPGNPALPSAPKAPPPFLDVNGDNLITPADVLVIVNFINAGGVAEGEGGSFVDGLGQDQLVGGGSSRQAAVSAATVASAERAWDLFWSEHGRRRAALDEQFDL